MHNPPPAGFPAMIECWCCARVENRRGDDIHESTKETELCSSCKEAGKCWSCRRCEKHCPCTIEQLELASKNWETQGIPSIAARLALRALIQRGRFVVPGIDGFQGRHALPIKLPLVRSETNVPTDEPRSDLYVLRGMDKNGVGFAEVRFDLEVAMGRARWLAHDWQIEHLPINPAWLERWQYLAGWDAGTWPCDRGPCCLTLTRISYLIPEAQEDIGLTGLVKRFHGPEPLDLYDRLLEAAVKVVDTGHSESSVRFPLLEALCDAVMDIRRAKEEAEAAGE